jgi:hypothetical protein
MDDLNPTPNKEISRLEHEIPKKNKFLDSSKNVLVGLTLIAVIVGSFWISFQLGKRLLVPVKKIPQEKIEVAIPEAPPSIAHMQKLAELASVSGEAKKVVPAPGLSGRYYKVQVGMFAHKQNAVNLSAQLKSKGIEAFAKSVGSRWRVQAGAYKSKSDAQRAQRGLKSKGYESVLIRE